MLTIDSAGDVHFDTISFVGGEQGSSGGGEVVVHDEASVCISEVIQRYAVRYVLSTEAIWGDITAPNSKLILLCRLSCRSMQQSKHRGEFLQMGGE